MLTPPFNKRKKDLRNFVTALVTGRC